MNLLFSALLLASILAGESPTCNFETKLALAHISERNSVWYARGKPTDLDLTVALLYRFLPDPSLGAYYALGPGDLERMDTSVGIRTRTFSCPATTITTYRE